MREREKMYIILFVRSAVYLSVHPYVRHELIGATQLADLDADPDALFAELLLAEKALVAVLLIKTYYRISHNPCTISCYEPIWQVISNKPHYHSNF